MGSLSGLLVASALAATAAGTPPAEPAAPSDDAVLRFVAPFHALAGISHGMTAVDGRPLILDQRATTRVASGLRTVWYSCPDESQATGVSSLSFDFKAGQAYELVCRAGKPAQILAADGC